MARSRSSLGVPFAAALLAAGALVTPAAEAQSAPPPPPPGFDAQPPPPPPGYAQPPPGYAHPPPGYYPPPQPGYGYPHAAAPPGPARMDYVAGQPIPPGYRLEERSRRGLVVGGSVVFGIFYGISLLVASADNGRNTHLMWLYVPVAGPWIALSDVNIASGQLFILDGIAQTAGATMLIAGIAAPKKVLVRNDVVGGLELKLAPMIGTSGLGVGLTGSM